MLQKWFVKPVCGFHSKKIELFPTPILYFLCDFRSSVLIQYVKMKKILENNSGIPS